MISLAVLGFLLSIVVLFANRLWKRKNERKWALLRLLPGKKPWPLLGNVKDFGLLKSASEFNPLTIFFQTLEGLSIIYRKEQLFALWLGPQPVVLAFGARTLETIFKSSTLIEKGDGYSLLSEWLGDGLLTSGGKKWHHHRKVLTPTFHFRILDDFLPIMNEQAKIFVKKAEAVFKEKDFLDSVHHCAMYTFDVICENDQTVTNEQQNILFIETFQRIQTDSASHDRLYTSGCQRKNTPKDSRFGIQFTWRQEKVGLSGPALGTFRNYLRFKELREQVDTFIFAGYDTTGTTLGWILYLLGLYRDVQERLVEEIDDVFCGDKARDVTHEDLKGLKYMECVIKETQRLYTPVPMVSRSFGEDTKLGDYIIPKDTEVYLALHLLHRDPEVFPDPEVFDPDRFLPQNCIGRHPFAFTPFSAGPRNCIGQRFAVMEMKVLLCQVFRNFSVSSVEERDRLRIYPAAVLKNDFPLRLRIQNR